MIRSAWTHRMPEMNPAAPENATHEVQLLSRAMQVIANDACRGLRVQQLANRLGVTRRCLAKWFPRLVGCSPHEAIQRAIFDEVERLLLETDLRLVDIAACSGFRHSEYLTVAFIRRYGISPSEWRRGHRGPHSL